MPPTETMKRFIPFDKVKPLEQPLVGRKAYQLAFLKRRGFPVPEGWCLPASEHERAIREFAEKTDFFRLPPPDQKRMLPAIRDCIAAQEIQCLIRGDIEEIVSRHGGPFIVRSSAADEDGFYSCAGIYRSIADLSSQQAIADAIKEVWKSLWSNEAYVYREERNIPQRRAAMAVMVQLFIQAEAAGVLFTSNPVTGVYETVIDAHSGAADVVVSGRSKPSLARLAVENREDGSFSFEIIEMSTFFPLSPASLQDLVTCAASIEKLVGEACDIEWSYDGSIHVLQCRPLAVASGSTWTMAPLSDFTPSLLTPLSADFVRHYFEERYSSLMAGLGFRIPRKPLAISHHGRVYARHCPPGDCPPSGGLSPISPILIHERAMKLLMALPDEITSYHSAMAILFARAAAATAEKDLWSIGDRLHNLMAERDPVITLTYLLEYLMTCFNSLLPPSIAQYKDFFAEFSSLSGTQETAQFHRDLLKLAEKSSEEGDCCREKPDSALFPSMMREFLQHYASWTDCPFELSRKRLGEQPDLGSSIQGLIEGQGMALADKRCMDREERLKKVEKKLQQLMETCAVMEDDQSPGSAAEGGLTRGERLGDLARWIKYLVEAREVQRGFTLKATYFLRLMLIRIAAKLQARGLFDEKTGEEGIFYLRRHELECLRGLAGHEEAWKAYMASRKEEFSLWKEEHFPKEFTGSVPRPMTTVTGGGVRGAKLSGTGLGRGCVTARARVILEPGEERNFRAGEILVVPNCEPYWSIFFPLCAGFVAERGGSLSHAAILAREYGLPAVSVENATSLIETGSMITLDGSDGWIIVEGEK
jgi:rifampicin phosphotransferase